MLQYIDCVLEDYICTVCTFTRSHLKSGVLPHREQLEKNMNILVKQGCLVFSSHFDADYGIS